MHEKQISLAEADALPDRAAVSPQCLSSIAAAKAFEVDPAANPAPAKLDYISV
jgi:hypothetical protein